MQETKDYVNSYPNFLEKYKEQAKKQLLLSFPDIREEEIEEFLDKEINSTIQGKNVVFNDGEQKSVKNLLSVTEWLEEKKPIITGYGAFYRKHNEGVNLLSDMVDYLLVSRKKVKKEMFEHVNDEDRTEYNNLDLMQKTFKLLANSFYGATVEKNSIFFNQNFGPSITYSGVIIITTAVNAFENFMSNNFHFENLNDVLLYINNIQEQKYVYTHIINRNIESGELLQYLLRKWRNRNDSDIKVLSDIIERMDQQTLNKIYYKNNLYEFLGNNEISNLLGKVINKEFLDPNDPPKDIKDSLEMLWTYIQEWVLYNYLSFYRYENAENEKRQTVLVVDTDSNFLMLDPFYKYLKENYPDNVDETDEGKVSVVNIASYLLAKVIENVYWKMTSELNIPSEKRPIINMKNEFFYKRLMLTRNKKSYAGKLIMQEGRMFEKPKLDIKGLAIRKVSVNKNVRDYFTDMLDENILSSDKIDLSKVFGNFVHLQNEIANSLMNGEITYTLPSKANEIESYANPYAMQSIRGTIIWNELFPDNEIVLPTKVNLIKLTTESLNDLAGKIPMDVYKTIKETIYDNENLSKYGFTILCLPKSIKKLPEWVTPFIDIETMVNDHIKSGMIMLESLGFKILETTKQTQFPTNILTF
ncbi:putative DNA polymerase I [Bacillus phage vB_BspM_Internexus]|nr:putative DNA polymerase I [Bacillus phage vB_BspM_Internexus]